MFLVLIKKDPNIVLDDFVDVRSDPGNKKYFNEFFETFVTAVAGRRYWSKELKVHMPISKCDKIKVSDEAFAELLLINYFEKWKNKGKAKWTDTRSGNFTWQGWHPDAHTTFNTICARIKRQREIEVEKNALVDKLFQKYAIAKYTNHKDENHYMQCADVQEIAEAYMDEY